MVFSLQTGFTCYLSERTSATLLTMPFSSRVGRSTATVLWAAEPVDSHIRVHTWTPTGNQIPACVQAPIQNQQPASLGTDAVTLLSVFRVRSAAFLTDSWNRTRQNSVRNLKGKSLLCVQYHFSAHIPKNTTSTLIQSAYLYVIKDSEQRFPNFGEVTDEVVSLSSSNQVVQGQAANRKENNCSKTLYCYITMQPLGFNYIWSR